MTREKINRCSVLGIRDWDGAPRRVHAARETSRRDRCGIKKTRRGRVFLMALELMALDQQSGETRMGTRDGSPAHP